MSICKTQHSLESLTDLLTNRNWVKKNRYLHFRHPKFKQKKLSHFLLSVAAISQQLPGVQLPLCFCRIKQQKTSPETFHFLCRFSPIFTLFPNLPQLKSGPSPKQVHQATQEWQICAESQCSPGSWQIISPSSVVARPSLYSVGYSPMEVPGVNSSPRWEPLLPPEKNLSQLSLNPWVITTPCGLLPSRLENSIPWALPCKYCH